MSLPLGPLKAAAVPGSVRSRNSGERESDLMATASGEGKGTHRTDQAKAIQILLRDLGLYSGTTYGTVGPATREAIRKFQLAADEAETGEPSEMLFESLKKKKCASSVP
jgi:peptidoglycan hydrolase-like protein with peptidoglycan-binding domain